MKKILLLLIVISSMSFASSTNDQLSQAEVTFNGQSDKAYYFTNAATGKVIEITIVSKSAISKYDFNAKENIGKKFRITYEIDKIETVNKDTKNDVDVKQYKQRLILMDIEKIE